ncbi:MAG: T9SS type A sorting domain-containing protein [Bacteroidota bacterium]
MKRLTLIVTVIALSTVLAFSQNSAHTKTMEEVKKYIDDNVFPTIEKQQAKYLSNLSETEKTELNNIKEKRSSQKNGFSGKQNKKSGNNKSKNRYNNSENSLFPEVKKITDAHPKLNASYMDIIDNDKSKWIADIVAIHESNDSQPMHTDDGKMGVEMFFTRMANPEWLLLWDASNPRNTHAGMRTKSDFKGKRNMHAKAKLTPELRAEIKSYTTKNIIPVIASERKNFDEFLSDNEKKIIKTAREKIEVRKIMFKNWYESEDFEAGKRAKDPSFDNMRTDMQNSMAEVREIAIAHNDEISESIANIKSHAKEWHKEISTISEKNNQDPDETNMMIRQKMHKSQTPISFLLFNPNKAEEADLFGFNKEDEIKLIVYPNPVFENATIAILNAADNNIQAVLFTKEGEMVKTLYDGQNTKQRLEVMLNVSELNNDIYIVKVKTDGNEISRKIVISR